MYDGPRPDHRSAPNNCHWHGFNGSYQPMRKQGAIILGTGGDNSNGAVGSCESDGEAVEEPGSWRGEPAAMRGGGVRQSGRAVATMEEEEAPRNCIA